METPNRNRMSRALHFKRLIPKFSEVFMVALNETILIIVLTWCIATLFNTLVARTVHNAMIQQNPDAFGRAMRHCNRLDTIRDLVIGEQISFNQTT